MRTIVIQMIMAFFACLFFAIVYNTPKKELIFCGLFGAIGYGIYFYLYNYCGLGTMSNFIGALVIAILTRFVSVRRRIPIMLYVLPSVFPLSPGANMYKAAYAIAVSDTLTAIDQTFICIKVVGACVIAILIIVSLPDVIFNPYKKSLDKA